MALIRKETHIVSDTKGGFMPAKEAVASLVSKLESIRNSPEGSNMVIAPITVGYQQVIRVRNPDNGRFTTKTTERYFSVDASQIELRGYDGLLDLLAEEGIDENQPVLLGQSREESFVS